MLILRRLLFTWKLHGNVFVKNKYCMRSKAEKNKKQKRTKKNLQTRKRGQKLRYKLLLVFIRVVFFDVTFLHWNTNSENENKKLLFWNTLWKLHLANAAPNYTGFNLSDLRHEHIVFIRNPFFFTLFALHS